MHSRNAPKPPASIANALHGRLNAQTDYEERLIDELAQAVWDALLAEGEAMFRGGYRNSILKAAGAHEDLARATPVLVITLKAA